MEKPVHNPVENYGIMNRNRTGVSKMVHIKQFFTVFFIRFTQINNRKRYKLINFAPKKGMVHKRVISLTVNRKISTRNMNIDGLNVETDICKYSVRKFSTYQPNIIIFFSFF